jgi:hypothetical protein
VSSPADRPRPSPAALASVTGLAPAAPAGFIPRLISRGSAHVVYVLGTSRAGSGTHLALLRSTDNGGRFRPVTAPPATAPTRRSPLGDIQTLRFVSADDGYATQVGGDGAVRSVAFTDDGGRSWRAAHLPLHPTNAPWTKGTTIIGLTQATSGEVYELAISCVSGADCPRYRLLRARSWDAPWTAAAGPGSGSFNAAGAIGLSTFKNDVWLSVGNGEGPLRLFGSTDGGRRFEALETHRSDLWCSTQATSATRVWLWCSGGMLMGFARSSDGGRHFVDLPVMGSGTGGTMLWPVTDSLVFFRTDDGDTAGLYRSTDAGRVFTKLHDLPRAFGADGSRVTAMTFGTSRQGLVLTANGDVFGTRDGGTGWAKLKI